MSVEKIEALTEKVKKKLPQKDDEQPEEPQIVKEEIEEQPELEDPFASFDPYELLIGATVELEHTANVIDALKIATDHLTESPNYYTKLLTYVEPDFNPADKLKEEEIAQPGTPQDDIETKEYQTPGGSSINVGRMIKNMARVHIPRFDSKRNLADRFKIMFKMRSPKDDMNAAMQNRESFTIVGEFDEPADATKILNSLLTKKRNAQMLTNKEGKKVVIVEENYKLKEDNSMGNSGAVITTVIPDKKIKKKKVKKEGEEDGSN